MDFVRGTFFLTLVTGATETCTNIELVDDDIAMEGNETFRIELMSLFIPIPLDISTAEVIIIDDDSKSPYSIC